MKSVVILQDCNGYAERARAIRDAHPVVRCVSPFGSPGAIGKAFTVPDEWLPADESIPRAKRQWFKADIMGIAAVAEHRVKADFYWFIESDVVASQERWRAFFDDHKNDSADCIASRLRDRSNSLPEYWTHPGTPSWADRHFLTACFRLSARAVEECIRCAEEMRETFCEVSAASVIKRAGLTFSDINARQTHWNSQTFKGVDRCLVNPVLINHPVKRDSYAPDGL
jgi:hypothetical protein